MLNFCVGDTVHGFRVLREGDVPYLNAHYIKLEHVATGAALYYTDRDDGQLVFSVGFRTLPEDDTGVFHILEHSCLDGSEKYPLKEPFVNLMKTSMAVDLNAVTCSDTTLYYFISTNERDYHNLMTVYLDAVFFPKLLTDRRIFEKEAWHLEPDGNGGVKCSGVVFNEMQGNDNNPAYTLWKQNERQLFPDLPISHNSGGDPAAIRTLTYEQFTDTYRRFYSANNAIFYLSGHLELADALRELDGVLIRRGKSAIAPPAPAPMQSPVISPDGVAYYQLGETEEEAGNTRLMLSFVMEGERDTANALAMNVLGRYLAENTESPLSRAVLDAGVGQAFFMECDASYHQPAIGFSLGKSDPEQAERFRDVILQTLSNMTAEGLDKERLRNLVDCHEVICRRSALSPRVGFGLMDSFLRSHVQIGDVTTPDDLAIIRARMDADERYFESLIERHILNSRHWALTRAIPSRTVAAEKRAVMDAWLASEAERLHAEGKYGELEQNIEALNAYLTAPDSPEDEAKIPHLTPADIETRTKARDAEIMTTAVGCAEATSLRFDVDSSGMTQAGILFDMSRLDGDALFYARCLCKALLSLPTACHTVPELTDRWVVLQSNANVGILSDGKGTSYLSLEVDAPEDQLTEAVATLDEYVREVVFDREILRHIFSTAAHVRMGMIRGGSNTALRLGTRTLTRAGVVDEYMYGESAYRRFSELADRFDDHADALVEGMRRVWLELTQNVQPMAFHIGSAESYAAWIKATAQTSVARDVTSVAPAELALFPRVNTALTVEGEVNYCAALMDTTEIGGFTPRRWIVSDYLNSKYFWDEIRAKGGAYGASATASRQGIVAYASYRDPRVADTYAVFDRLPDWLEANLPEQSEIDSMIVSTVGSSYFPPSGPMDKGRAALNRYLMGLTASDIQTEITELLGTSQADFIAYAATVRTLMQEGKILRTALGNADAICASGHFDGANVREL